MNTIKVHRASIDSVLKMLNPLTALQEDTIHNIIHRMSILCPRTQEVLPRWHLSIVLKGLMKPPFAFMVLIGICPCRSGYWSSRIRASSPFPFSSQSGLQDFEFRSQTSLHYNGAQIHCKEPMSQTYSETVGIPGNSSFISK